jgi:pimeloyl-ACP methyl ester carboxylesterase
MKKTNASTIVFITGLFVSTNCWDEWIAFFESKGFTCLAPPHPHKNATAEVLRSRQPNEKVASNTLQRLVNHYADIINKQPEPPILIGHSMGGLIVQLLLQQGLGSAGVAIHPVPPRGVVSLRWSLVKAIWGPLGFFTSSRKSYLMNFEQWQYNLTNGMSLPEQRRSYYQYVIPESKKVVRDALTKVAEIDFAKLKAPLLIMAGNQDRMAPATVSRTTYNRYRKNNLAADYKEFNGRNHFVLGQPQWQENAAYILQWLNND